MTQLVLLYSDEPEADGFVPEAIVMDTRNLTREQLEAEYGLPVQGLVEVADPLGRWPTDRTLWTEH